MLATDWHLLLKICQGADNIWNKFYFRDEVQMGRILIGHGLPGAIAKFLFYLKFIFDVDLIRASYVEP